MSTLLEKMVEIGKDIEENATRNMSPKSLAAADAAFESIVDNVVTEAEDLNGDIDPEKLAGIRMAMRFGTRLLDAMVGHTGEEIVEAMNQMGEL